jgi:hypothetical protein
MSVVLEKLRRVQELLKSHNRVLCYDHARDGFSDEPKCPEIIPFTVKTLICDGGCYINDDGDYEDESYNLEIWELKETDGVFTGRVYLYSPCCECDFIHPIIKKVGDVWHLKVYDDVIFTIE